MGAATGAMGNRLARRNQELGHILATAREQQRRSVREWAALLGTSRRRYRAIERGEVGITVAEFAVMAEFLSLSLRDVLSRATAHQEDERLVVRVRPGDRVQVEFVVEHSPRACAFLPDNVYYRANGFAPPHQQAPGDQPDAGIPAELSGNWTPGMVSLEGTNDPTTTS
jgi:transcriptional regulator with XRE-family HTH domain